MNAAHGSDPLRGIPLEALRGFEAAARLLNFTRAAEELHLTQSAVSREIRSLEERLGTRLFERAKGGLRLTRAGVDLREDVSAALATIRRGIERVAAGGDRRSVLVVTNRSMLSDWLWNRVADYTNLHPDVDLRLAPAPRTGTAGERRGLEDIDSTDMDVGIRLLTRATADGRWERLMTEYVFPCCSKALAEDPRRPIRALGDLARHTLLELDDGMPALDANWPVWCARAKVAPPAAAGWKRVPDWALIFALAAQGQGVCMGRVPSINDRLRQGVLVAPLAEVTLSTRAWYLVQSARSRNDPRAGAFVDWLRSEARREEAFAGEFLAGKRVIGD